MDEKRAEIDVAALADAAQAPSLAAGVFTRRNTQIAGEAAPRGEALDVDDKGNECRSCEKADTGRSCCAGRRGECRELEEGWAYARVPATAGPSDGRYRRPPGGR